MAEIASPQPPEEVWCGGKRTTLLAPQPPRLQIMPSQRRNDGGTDGASSTNQVPQGRSSSSWEGGGSTEEGERRDGARPRARREPRSRCHRLCEICIDEGRKTIPHCNVPSEIPHEANQCSVCAWSTKRRDLPQPEPEMEMQEDKRLGEDEASANELQQDNHDEESAEDTQHPGDGSTFDEASQAAAVVTPTTVARWQDLRDERQGRRGLTEQARNRRW